MNTTDFGSSIWPTEKELWNFTSFSSNAKEVNSLTSISSLRLLQLKAIRIVWNSMVKNLVALMNYEALEFSQ